MEPSGIKSYCQTAIEHLSLNKAVSYDLLPGKALSGLNLVDWLQKEIVKFYDCDDKNLYCDLYKSRGILLVK